MVISQDRHKKYVDGHRLDHHFLVVDRVFFRVHVRKSTIHYGKGSKLAPHFFRPLEILERIGLIYYRLALPPSLSCIHDVFHVYVLRQYIPNVSYVLDWDALQVGPLTLEPICIL